MYLYPVYSLYILFKMPEVMGAVEKCFIQFTCKLFFKKTASNNVKN